MHFILLLTTTFFPSKINKKQERKYNHAEEKIYDLARQNAINIVRALVNPFVEQLDNDYKIEIE